MTNSNLLQPWQLPAQPWTVNLKRPAAGLVSGGLWGLLILGGGSRVAMRLVALLMGIPPSATATGTLGLLMMGAFVGGVIGLLYALITRWLPWHWRTNGALFGILLTAVALQPFVGLFIRSVPLFPWLAQGKAGSGVEWIIWGMLALSMVGVLLRSWRQPAQLVMRVTLGTFGLPFLLLWLAILVTPAMQLRGWTGLQATVAVAPYLTIWLLLPVGLSWVAWRRA